MAKTAQRRPDRQFVRTIKDPRTGKRLYFYGKTEREVNRKLLEFTRKAELGRTFAEVADEWWGEAYDAISPTSVRGYRVAKESALEYFGDMNIREITARDVYAYMQMLAAKQYAKKTVKNYKIVLNRIFSHALREGDIQQSPASYVDIPRGLKEKRRTAATVSDEEKILESADVWLFPYMALLTGLRKGELLALQWKDINFEDNMISVTKSLYYEGGAHIKSTKTDAGVRLVPLLSPLKSKLEPLKKKADDYVLGELPGKPLSQKRFRTLEKHFHEDTGTTATMHQLRKSYATIAVKEGVPPKVLQTVLGHKDISTTLNIYAEVRKDAISSAGNLLENFFASR